MSREWDCVDQILANGLQRCIFHVSNGYIARRRCQSRRMMGQISKWIVLWKCMIDQPYHHGAIHETAVELAIRALRVSPGSVPSLRELARRMSVTHRALYRHFPDRRGVTIAVAARGFQLLADRIEGSLVREQSRRAVMAAYLDFAFAEPGLYKLMFSTGAAEQSLSPALKAQVQRVISSASTPFGLLTSSALDLDEVVSTWGMAHGLCLLWFAGILRVKTPELARDYILSRLEQVQLI